MTSDWEKSSYECSDDSEYLEDSEEELNVRKQLAEIEKQQKQTELENNRIEKLKKDNKNKQLKRLTSTPERDQLNFGAYDFMREIFRMQQKKLQNSKWYMREISVQQQKMLSEKLNNAKKIYNNILNILEDKFSELNYNGG